MTRFFFQNFSSRLPFIILFIVTLLIVGIRLMLLQLPLDRDEGEYAYAGWRMLHGGVPYLDFYNMKMPGVHTCYALLFLLFGESVQAIRLGLLFLNLGSATMIFMLGKRLGNFRTGIYSAICYLLFSFAMELQGMSTNAEHFTVIFLLAGLVIYIGSSNKQTSANSIFFSGFMLGIACLMKQPSAVFIPMIIVLMIIRIGNKFITLTAAVAFLRSLFLFVGGVLLPILLTIIILYKLGATHRFFFFTIDYARQYISYIGWNEALDNCLVVLRPAVKNNIFLWLIAGVGLIATGIKSSPLHSSVVIGSSNKIRGNVPSSVFLFIFLIFSFIAVCPGFYFRPHYFQYLMPALSLLAATGLTSLEDFWKNKISENRRFTCKIFLSNYCSSGFLLIAIFFFSINKFIFLK